MTPEMSLTEHTALHLRQVFFGGNWTAANYRDVLSDISWEHAKAETVGVNSIATLFHHSTYYITVQLKVMAGGALEGKDEDSFYYTPFHNQEEWIAVQEKKWAEVHQLADLIEFMPENQLWTPFTEEKYGSYFRNLIGMIEHSHYHLGQIVLCKRLLTQSL